MKKINEIVEEYLAKKIFSEVPESKPIFRAENFGVALQSDGKNILHFDCEYVSMSAVKRAENPDPVRGRFELILDPKLRSKDEASPCDMSEKPEYRLIADKIDFVLEAYGFPRNWIAQAAEGIHKPLPERVVTDIQKGLLDQYLSQVEPLWDLDEALDDAMNEKNCDLPRYFIEYAHQKCLNCMKEEQDIAGSLQDSRQNSDEDRRLLESSCGNEPQFLETVFEHELAYEVLGDREKRMCVTRIEPSLVLDEFGWPNPGVKLDLRIRDKHSLLIVKDLPVALCDSKSRTGVVIGTKIDAHISFLLGHHIEDILQAYNYSYEAVLETLDCRNGLTVTKKDFYAIGKYLAAFASHSAANNSCRNVVPGANFVAEPMPQCFVLGPMRPKSFEILGAQIVFGRHRVRLHNVSDALCGIGRIREFKIRRINVITECHDVNTFAILRHAEVP